MTEFRRLSAAQSAFLDAFRYLAALLVCLHHSLGPFYHDWYFPLSRSAFSNLGSIGVAAFFLLSGFLIAYTIVRKGLDRGRYGFGTYVVERSVRIYLVFLPALLLAVAVNFINLTFVHDNVPSMEFFTAENFWVTLFMLNGVEPFSGHSEIMPFIGPAWTINYEFWQYILLGALMLSLEKSPAWLSWLVRVVVFTAVILLVHQLPGFRDLALVWCTGAAVAFVFLSPYFERFGAVVSTALAATAILWFQGGEQGLMASILVTLLLVALFAGQHLAIPRSLVATASFLAGYSYSLYLTHVIVVWVVRHVGLKTHAISLDRLDFWRAAWLVAAVLLANVFAFLFSRLTEAHTGQVRRLVLGQWARPPSAARIAEPAE